MAKRGLPLIAAAALILAACSGQAPSIISLHWTLILKQDAQGGRTETLSVFASVSDPDGKADLDMMYIANDSSELVWKLDPDSWVEKDRDGGFWIGSNALSMPEAAPLPRGAYKVIVVDAAGDRDQGTFALGETPPVKALSARISGSTLSVEAPFSQTNAIILDASGATLASVSLATGSVALESILGGSGISSTAESLIVMSADEARNIAVQSAAILLP
jgi:hypothetical protein